MNQFNNKKLQSLKDKIEAKQNRREKLQRIRISNKKVAKYNFGRTKDGRIVTSTSNGKAHTMNKLMRRIMFERDKNFALMKAEFDSLNCQLSLTRQQMFDKLEELPVDQLIGLVMGIEPSQSRFLNG